MCKNYGWIASHGQLKWASRPWPEEHSDWSNLRLELGGICGTDIQIIGGYADFAGFLGHEFVATDLKTGQRVVGEINVGCGCCSTCLQGDQRFCSQRSVLGIRGLDGCFAQRFQLPTKNLYPVDDLAPELAVWTEPLAAALNVEQYLPVNCPILILGDGRLAALIGLALKDHHDITVAGRHPEKVERLQAIGLKTTTTITDLWPAVIEATGSAQGINQALQICRPQGTVIVKSTVAGHFALDTNLIIINNLKVIGSRCGHFLPALEALRSGRIDPRPLIDQICSLEQLPQAFQRSGGFKTLVRGLG